jgi:LytS/YehU family sensor histidine kinase
MNPHFMFNALNTIQEFIITNQQDIASEYLADFADLMRKYLDQSKKEDISVQEELDTLSIYLRLENLRFDGALDYSIEYDEQLDIDSIMIPVMSIQPFVENSIKHGLLHKSGDKKLQIEVRQYGRGYIKCIVTDNGIGRKASAERKKHRATKHQSFATQAIDERLAMLNANQPNRVELEIIDLESDEEALGTRVELTVHIDH